VLTNEEGLAVKEILPFEDYYRLASYDPLVERKRHSDLLAFAKELHELIWTAAKISEEDKPLLVSGTLIALMNQPFLKSFQFYSAEDIGMPKTSFRKNSDSPHRKIVLLYVLGLKQYLKIFYLQRYILKTHHRNDLQRQNYDKY
jgi:hypothetical protein